MGRESNIQEHKENCVTENNCRYVQIKPTSCVMPQCSFAFQGIQQHCKPKLLLSSPLPLKLRFLASQSSLHVYFKCLFSVKHCYIGFVVHRSSANTVLVHLSCSVPALIPGKDNISVARDLQQVVPEQFRAGQKVKHVVKGIVQMPQTLTGLGILRWPLRSPSMAVAEPTGSGPGICRAEPAPAAASLCLLHKQTERGLSMRGSAEQLHRAPRGCIPLSPSCWHVLYFPVTERVRSPPFPWPWQDTLLCGL